MQLFLYTLFLQGSVPNVIRCHQNKGKNCNVFNGDDSWDSGDTIFE